MNPPATLVLLVLISTAALTVGKTEKIRKKEAYVSLIYGDSYALAIRVMMLSLRMNSPDVAAGIRDRVVLITGHTSTTVEHQMRHDGIIVRRIDEMKSPYTQNSKFHTRFNLVMTKLKIFNMTEYTRVVFLDADSLVLNDMSSLFACGNFCAAFINPCYFNSGLMLLTPNETLFKDMTEKLPTTPSYDGGDQGFLNAYFPNLLDAPLFDSDKAVKAETTPPAMARLPFSWHVDHSAYYPTFSFAFSGSDRCGKPRDIEWLGPPIAKPWLWWTYAVFDLSWQWYAYRVQLFQQYPPELHARRNAFLLMVASYTFVFAMARFFQHNKAALLSVLFCPVRLLAHCDDTLICFYGVIFGTVLWAGGFFASMIVVPGILTPWLATVVFSHVRVAFSLGAMSLLGFALCAGRGRRQGRVRDKRIDTDMLAGVNTLQVFAQLMMWAIADACYLVVWVGVLWRIPFATMWAKLAAMLGVFASQLFLAGSMMSSTCLIWLSVADSVEMVK